MARSSLKGYAVTDPIQHFVLVSRPRIVMHLGYVSDSRAQLLMRTTFSTS